MAEEFYIETLIDEMQLADKSETSVETRKVNTNGILRNFWTLGKPTLKTKKVAFQWLI